MLAKRRKIINHFHQESQLGQSLARLLACSPATKPNQLSLISRGARSVVVAHNSDVDLDVVVVVVVFIFKHMKWKLT